MGLQNILTLLSLSLIRQLVPKLPALGQNGQRIVEIAQRVWFEANQRARRHAGRDHARLPGGKHHVVEGEKV